MGCSPVERLCRLYREGCADIDTCVQPDKVCFYIAQNQSHRCCRLKHNHYAGPNEKNVLIVVEGFGRLRDTSFHSVYEMFRSLYDTGEILSETGEPIKLTAVVGS